MNPSWYSLLGLATAATSALALYAASSHCRWLGLRRWTRGARAAGALLAVLSLVSWITALGPAVGVCAMLATWMLAMVALPYLALLTGTASADPDGDT